MDEYLVADSYKQARAQRTQSLFLAESSFFGHPRFNFPLSEIDQPDMPEETVIEEFEKTCLEMQKGVFLHPYCKT